jgi:hypothetical protein
VSAGPPIAPGRGELIDLAVPLRCPPAAAFALLADVQDSEPLPRRATVRMVKDPPGPTTVGTRWHERVRLAPGVWLPVENVVTDVSPPARLGLDFTAPGFGGHLDYRVEPTADGCVLHHREVLRTVPPLRRLGPALARSRRRHVAERLADIRFLLEREDRRTHGGGRT